jgi:dipeptidase
MCFFVVVGKNASATGRPIQAYTNNWSDELTCFLELSPSHDITLGPLAKLPYFSLLPSWVTDHQTYRTLEFRVHDMSAVASGEDAWAQEGGYNSAGLAINFGCATYLLDSETNTLDPWVDDGTGFGGEMWRLLLLTCTRARQALDLIELLARCVGLASDFCGSFAISDAAEAWVVEAVAGHAWIASRVPDNHYWVQPNMLITRHFDLSDRDNFRGSEGLAAFARKTGLLAAREESTNSSESTTTTVSDSNDNNNNNDYYYKNNNNNNNNYYYYNNNKNSSSPLESCFDYAKVFNGPDWLRNNYSRHRLWGTVRLLSPSLNYPIEDESCDRVRPSSFSPDKPITYEMLREVIACHYEGTEIEAGRRRIAIENDANDANTEKNANRYSPHCNEGDNTSKATIECDYATSKETKAKITPICRNTSTYAAIFPLAAISSEKGIETSNDDDEFFARSYMIVAPYAPCIAYYTPVFLHQRTVPRAWLFAAVEDVENPSACAEKVAQSEHRRTVLSTMQALDGEAGSQYYRHIGNVRARQSEYDSLVQQLIQGLDAIESRASSISNDTATCDDSLCPSPLLVEKMERISHESSLLYVEKAALVLSQINRV